MTKKLLQRSKYVRFVVNHRAGRFGDLPFGRAFVENVIGPATQEEKPVFEQLAKMHAEETQIVIMQMFDFF